MHAAATMTVSITPTLSEGDGDLERATRAVP
jgi:hypothetical protein